MTREEGRGRDEKWGSVEREEEREEERAYLSFLGGSERDSHLLGVKQAGR